MKFTSSQTSFKSGRLSPKLYNRVDTTQYRDGASQMSGCRPMLEGGADRLKGYRYLKHPVFDQYALEPTWPEMKVFGVTIKGNDVCVVIVPQADNSVILYSIQPPYSTGDFQQVTLLPAGSYAYAADEFSYAVHDQYLFITHYSGKMNPRVVQYDADGVMTGSTYFQLIQSSPLIFPMSDLGDVSGTITISNWNSTNFTVDITSADADVVTILQTVPTIHAEKVVGYSGFGDGITRNIIVSNLYAVTASITNGVRCTYTNNYTIGASVGIDMILGFGGSSVSTDAWATGLWYTDNWPRVVTSHEGRVVFGGTPEKPLTFFGSKTNNPFKFNQLKFPPTGSELVSLNGLHTGDTLLTDPYVFTVGSKEDSAITFLEATETLVIGTNRKEYIADGGDTTLSALSVKVKAQTAQGSVPLVTASNGKAVYYISSYGKQLFKFKYNSANGSFISQEVSLLFNDLLEDDQIKNIVWASHISAIMILMESGKIYGITDNDQTDTMAFFETGIEDADCLTFIGKEEELGPHVLFTRTDGGLNSLEQLYYEYGPTESGIKLDQVEENAYLYYDRVISMNWGGGFVTDQYNWHSTNIVQAGGWPIPWVSATFLSPYFDAPPLYIINKDTGEVDEFTLDPDSLDDYQVYTGFPSPENGGTCTGILIGIAPRPMELATMPIEAGQQWGTSQMGIKNIDKIGIRFYRSYSVQVSSGEGDPQVWEEVVIADEEGNAHSGRKELQFSASPKYDQIVYLRNTKAEPCTIVGLNMRGLSNDG